MIVSIWGSSGSGKSTIALKLSNLLALTGKKVILIDSNFVVPQIGVWFPKAELSEQCSLSSVLQNEINKEILSHKIYIAGDNLGVLGYSSGEPVMSSILQRYDTAAVLLNTAASIADYVVVDCQTNITQDYLTFVAIEMSHVKFITCTPDLLAVSFWLSNICMLGDEKYRISSAYRVLNKVKDISPVAALESRIGKFHFSLPYNSNTEHELLGGNLPNVKRKRKTKRLNSVLNSMVYELLSLGGGELQ